MNRKGFVSMWLLFFIIFFVIGTSIFFEVHQSRSVLAEDIKSGKLILTVKATEMITRGDLFLKDAGVVVNEKGSSNYIKSTAINEKDLFRAFIAKVWFERARLEMEMDK